MRENLAIAVRVYSNHQSFLSCFELDPAENPDDNEINSNKKEDKKKVKERSGEDKTYTHENIVCKFFGALPQIDNLAGQHRQAMSEIFALF